MVPQAQALVLVNKFIAIVRGTAEFSSLAAQKAALNVIAEIGLLAGETQVPRMLEAVLYLLNSSENRELQDACERQLSTLIRNLPPDHPMIAHLQGAVDRGMHSPSKLERMRALIMISAFLASEAIGRAGMVIATYLADPNRALQERALRTALTKAPRPVAECVAQALVELKAACDRNPNYGKFGRHEIGGGIGASSRLTDTPMHPDEAAWDLDDKARNRETFSGGASAANQMPTAQSVSSSRKNQSSISGVAEASSSSVSRVQGSSASSSSSPSSFASRAFMQKRGYKVPFEDNDHLNTEFLAGDRYIAACAFYGVHAMMGSQDLAGDDSVGYDGEDSGANDEDDEELDEKNTVGLRKGHLSAAMQLAEWLSGLHGPSNGFSNIMKALLQLANDVDLKAEEKQDTGPLSVMHTVLFNIDQTVKFALESEERMLAISVDDNAAARAISDKSEEEQMRDDEERVERVIHGVVVSLTLLATVAAIQGRVPSQVISLRDLAEKIAVSSCALRDNLSSDSELLRLLEHDTNSSSAVPVIATQSQFEAWIRVKGRIDEAQRSITARQKLSEETRVLACGIEQGQDRLWLWSRAAIVCSKRIGKFYMQVCSPGFSGSKTVPTQYTQDCVEGYRWFLSRVLSEGQPHRGIRSAHAASIGLFIDQIAAFMQTDEKVHEKGSTEQDAFLGPNASGLNTPLSSPPMLSEANDLAATMYKRLYNRSTGAKFESAISDLEVGLLARACVVNKNATLRRQVVAFLIALWTHPNSAVRHVSLRGFEHCCEKRVPEVMDMTKAEGKASSPVLVARIQQRLQERDCDDEDKILLQNLLAWFYSSFHRKYTITYIYKRVTYSYVSQLGTPSKCPFSYTFHGIRNN